MPLTIPVLHISTCNVLHNLKYSMLCPVAMDTPSNLPPHPSIQKNCLHDYMLRGINWQVSHMAQY